MKTKFKTSTENNSESKIKTLLKNNNFRNNQNYVINQLGFFKKYIINIDKTENLYSRLIIYSMLICIFWTFYWINNIISKFKEINTFSNYWYIIIIFSLISLVILYLLFIFKYKIFAYKRIKKYFVLKYNPFFNKTKITKK